MRSRRAARALGPSEVDRALEVCAEDPVMNVFVAARIIETQLRGDRGPLFGHDLEGEGALCWCSANVVPVHAGPRSLAAFADKVVRRRRWASSVFGPVDQVLDLWARLEPSWGAPREVRAEQLVMTVRPGDVLGVPADPHVRLARPDEVDRVVPASEAMFTEEIGYPPYQGSSAGYRRSVLGLIEKGHTFVRTDHTGAVIFKADLGSVALGVAQVQGVWVHPRWRGQGLAAPAMAAVVQQTMARVAPAITLYVNDFNTAVATYRRAGFVRTGTFATVLL
ncbi:GNAT family N-acetyltransferase [Ornithinimicrobium sp. CNJ-824]|nr:GNAT family N-acetyltransferase [Ornithinimicrobium sp. CNJ-824]